MWWRQERPRVSDKVGVAASVVNMQTITQRVRPEVGGTCSEGFHPVSRVDPARPHCNELLPTVSKLW